MSRGFITVDRERPQSARRLLLETLQFETGNECKRVIIGITAYFRAVCSTGDTAVQLACVFHPDPPQDQLIPMHHQ